MPNIKIEFAMDWRDAETPRWVLQLEEMRMWCRHHIGKNPSGRGCKKLWGTNYSYRTNVFLDAHPGWRSNEYVRTFSFSNEADATMFVLRWSGTRVS